MPVADWIKALHSDLDERIAAAESKLASKSTTVSTTVSETPVTPKKETKAKTPDAPKKAPKVKDADVEKRIKRMSPTLTKQLTTVFQDAKKEFKKENGVEFAKYVNDLSKDDFEAKNLSDHMRDFVGAGPVPVAPEPEPKKKAVKKTPAPEPEPVVDEDLVEVTFNKVKYVVGEISKIVYEANDDGDKRVGLLGLGKFAKMQLPA
jgi:hypothetical protein